MANTEDQPKSTHQPNGTSHDGLAPLCMPRADSLRLLLGRVHLRWPLRMSLTCRQAGALAVWNGNPCGTRDIVSQARMPELGCAIRACMHGGSVARLDWGSICRTARNIAPLQTHCFLPSPKSPRTHETKAHDHWRNFEVALCHEVGYWVASLSHALTSSLGSGSSAKVGPSICLRATRDRMISSLQ